MAALSHAAAVRALNDGDRAPIWYLTGDEDVLKQDLIDAVLAAQDPSTRDFNVDVRQAGDLNGESFTALVDTPPMMADQRLVVVRGLEQWRKNAKVWDVLYGYLKQPNPTTMLVLVHGVDEKADPAIAKAARHVDLSRPSPTERAAWLARRARKLGTTITNDALAHLLVTVADDLGTAARELEKLAVSADDAITLAHVQDLVGIRHGETIHDWADAVILRDVPRATQLVDVVLTQSGNTGVRLVMLLGTALLGTRLARALLDQGTRGKAAEKHVFEAIRAARPMNLRSWGAEAALWVRAAERWTGAALDDALRAAYVADGQLKSTTVTDERGTLLSLMLSLAPTERAA